MKKYISLLLVLFLVSGCSFSFNMKNKEEVKENDISNSTAQSTTKKYNYEDMIGEYSGGQLLDESNEGPKTAISLHLRLYKNGTFSYLVISGGVPSGYVGNYTIEDNTINLNYLFEISGKNDVLDSKFNKNLTIKSDDTIVDPKYDFADYSLTDLELKKITDERLSDIDESFGFNAVVRSLIK